MRLAVLCAFFLFIWGVAAPALPSAGLWGGLTIALLVDLILFAGLIGGLSPLRSAGVRALLVAGVAAGLSVPFGLAGWVAAANVAKAVAAAGLGYWLIGAIESLAIVVLVAGLSAVVDIISVAVGPTRTLLESAPQAIGFLTVAFVWPGEDPTVFYTALGVADLVFFALYVGAARKFQLRATATVAGVALGIAAAIVVGIWLGPMPALPWLAAGFLAVNADVLVRRLRATSSSGPSSF